MQQNFKVLGLIIFGVVLPSLMFFSAYFGMEELVAPPNINSLQEIAASSARWTNDQYTLFSSMYLENVNYTVVRNKQGVKFSVMKIGFAVSSVGIALLILGFDRRQGAEGQFHGVSLKLESFGALVFVVGSLVAAYAGIVANEYQTSQTPNYFSDADYISKRHIFQIMDSCAKNGKLGVDCVRVGVTQLEGG
ncbi:hypothetical protein [Crenobacter caeni]|uniref:Uncharacterized protein n=1 Tax=Crenobacter caeni TaxID=2705474 RepID=A0A6B2KMD7_9NEIS|nr:hypothetical protein [Crenobacter caeni]NDV11386.1 hypothetical protein [Crenobacter caeni]